MSSAFLLVLAAFLVIAAPPLLVGACREGNRRREARARDMASMRASIDHGCDDLSEGTARSAPSPSPPSPRMETAPDDH